MKFHWMAVAALTAAAFAQQGPGGPPANQGPPSPDALKTALGLTDTQVTSLVQLQTQKRAQIQPIRQQIGDKQRAIRDALAKDNPDATAIAALLVQVTTLERQAKAIASGYATQALAILTAEQKTKLKDLEKALSLEIAARQAVGLDLLTPPAPPAGQGPAGMGGPGPNGIGRPGTGQGPMAARPPR